MMMRTKFFDMHAGQEATGTPSPPSRPRVSGLSPHPLIHRVHVPPGGTIRQQ